MKNRGALELSVGTMVVIVLALAMLILGMVLVRNIMCGAVGLTGEINTNIRGEVNKLFETSGGEVVCIGAGGKPVSLVPGELNIIYCSIKASESAVYTITSTIPSEAEDWIVGEVEWSGEVAPGDDLPKKILKLDIPENAPRKYLSVRVNIEKDGTRISTQDLDFEVRDFGVFTSAIC